MMSILFLDLDGVLNGHQYDEGAKSNTLDPVCVRNLNKVLDKTDCSIVLSSAWRYMIIKGAMTLTGFEYMLRTHSVHCVGKLIGHTEEDDQILRDPSERGRQIKRWLENNKHTGPWAAVDDLHIFNPWWAKEKEPFVCTNSRTGMTEKDADALIDLLRP